MLEYKLKGKDVLTKMWIVEVYDCNEHITKLIKEFVRKADMVKWVKEKAKETNGIIKKNGVIK